MHPLLSTIDWNEQAETTHWIFYNAAIIALCILQHRFFFYICAGVIFAMMIVQAFTKPKEARSGSK